MRKIFGAIILILTIFSHQCFSSDEIEDKLEKYYTNPDNLSTAEQLGYFDLFFATPMRLQMISNWDFETTKKMLLLEFEYPKLDPITFQCMLKRYYILRKAQKGGKLHD